MKINKTIMAILALVIMTTCLVGVIILKPNNILGHNSWDSFTRQAMAWRHNITYLDEDPESVAYLELAIYKEKLYVSFPPVPSLVEYPLTYIFGSKTPDTLLLYIYSVLSAVFLTLTLLRKHKPQVAICFGILGTAATNLLAVTRFGGVWHESQALSFLLCSMGVYFILSKKRREWYWGLFCAALAVGCRPFVVFFIPAMLYVLYENIKCSNLEVKKYTKVGFNEKKIIAIAMLPFLILPGLVAAGLMWYNYIRFGNPLEFGHNYLPEFMRAEHGQFSIYYASTNFLQSFRLPTVHGTWEHFSLLNISIPYFKLAKDPLSLEMYSANAFYLVNPIIFLYVLYTIRDAVKKVRLRSMLFFSGFILMIVVTCMHKTLGGYQFGARYFIDMIPFLVLYLTTTKLRVGYLEWTLCIFGVALNLWGISILNF